MEIWLGCDLLKRSTNSPSTPFLGIYNGQSRIQATELMAIELCSGMYPIRLTCTRIAYYDYDEQAYNKNLRNTLNATKKLSFEVYLWLHSNLVDAEFENATQN